MNSDGRAVDCKFLEPGHLKEKHTFLVVVLGACAQWYRSGWYFRATCEQQDDVPCLDDVGVDERGSHLLAFLSDG